MVGAELQITLSNYSYFKLKMTPEILKITNLIPRTRDLLFPNLSINYKKFNLKMTFYG